MFDLLRLKSKPKGPELVTIPNKQFGVLVHGAMEAMHELKRIAKHAKSRLRDHERIIESADVEELIRMLVDARERIDAEMEADDAKSTDTSETQWHEAGYNTLFAPTMQMADAPQTIIDLTLAAANNGAKSAELLYKLMVAEMDVAVARFYVTLNTGLITERSRRA